MVLTAFRGQVNTGGYSIEITDVEDTASEIVVKCITKDPPDWVITRQVMSQPFHVASEGAQNVSLEMTYPS